MKIKIVQIGKTKGNFFDEAIAEFEKRIRIYADIKIVTLKEIPPKKTFTTERCRQEEGEIILSFLKNEKGFVVALDEKGQELDSREFAEELGRHKDKGETLIFVIGGPFGLSDAVKTRANRLQSFSRMTFTHQMIRIILLEQIFRGFSILTNSGYHH